MTDIQRRAAQAVLHQAEKTYTVPPQHYYDTYNVKKGLRNSDGTGVMAGITTIGDVRGYIVEDGERVPVEGRLRYRGIDIHKLIDGCQKDGRFGFEEVAYLILLGELPNKSQLDDFSSLIGELRRLPNGFIEDMILKAPSTDIMNKLARGVLALYSYDENPDDLSLPNLLSQSTELIARFSSLAAYGYQAKRHYHDNKSLFLHANQPHLSTAENFLHLIREDNKYTKLEAEILDLLLILQAEHGGGNNSAFATRVVSSSGTDTYSAIAAAIGSLKGPKHGGANAKVMGMVEDFKANVADWENPSMVADHIAKILRKEAYDKAGLVYGMGHAIYTISDPRADILKQKARELAEQTGRMKEFTLYSLIEDLTPSVFAEVKKDAKVVSANVDLYSGFVYSMLGIPAELYTPLFAISRIVGWCAHRIEEVVTCGRIIRPGYKAIIGDTEYIELAKR